MHCRTLFLFESVGLQQERDGTLKLGSFKEDFIKEVFTVAETGCGGNHGSAITGSRDSRAGATPKPKVTGE